MRRRREYRQRPCRPRPGPVRDQARNPRGGGVQHVKAIPVFGDHTGRVRNLAGSRKNRGTVGMGQRALPDNDHRAFGGFQDLAERMRAVGNLFKGLRPGTEMLVAIGQIDCFTDHTDLKAALHHTLAQTRIDNRRFQTWIRPHDQAGIGVFNPGNCRVERITCRAPVVSFAPS